MQYEVVIGLEVHAQLSTASKMFCGCSTAFGASPNAHTCEVCLGMPGVLPVVNAHAVLLAVRTAMGFGCTVHARSQWSRKNYFYPDLPKGYQITQYDKPFATQGVLHIETEGVRKAVGITRIHMEEDAGKNVHDDMVAGARSYVDFNRGGTPLVEIVSEPDLRSSSEAVAYLKSLRQVLRYLGVCDGNMEEGSLRCDANVSIRPVGSSQFGTRVEIKNINSFRFVQQAIEYEILRQTEVLQQGGKIVQETRLWDTQAKTTRSMRSKEDAHDYRYFPEPDLPDLVLKEAFLQQVKESLPELPEHKVQRYVNTLGLSEYDARVLTEDADVARVFEDGVAVQPNYKAVANWIINEYLRELKDKPLSSMPFGGREIGALVRLIDSNTISGKIAKEVFAQMLLGKGTPEQIVENNKLTQVTDASSVVAWVEQVLAENPDSVERYRAGKTNVMGFLVGQVIKLSGGKANPPLVNAAIKEKLGG
jgi:aspartyl-tRNA(Asn)/glutamyl-tRNA(Gln) amidotransferase subunit B